MSKIREPFNALSHLVGAILVVLGTGYLVFSAQRHTDAWISFLVFGVVSCFLYVSSTIYHWTGTVKNGLQKMDHAAIYLMIAGCYTPLCVVTLVGATGWAILILQWTLAAIGIVVTLSMTKPPIWIRLVLYLVMGWMVLPFVGQFMAHTTPLAVIWLIAGGLFYTIGVIFYASRKPTLWPGKFSSHELWHVFVIGGTFCHFMLMHQILTGVNNRVL